MGASANYINQTELKSIASRSNLWGAWLTLHVWGVIFGAMAIGIIWPLSIPFMIAIIGARQHGLAILMHDCAHGVLFNNRAANDWIGQYILAAPYGGDMHIYRKYHLKHHKYTQSDKDPDIGLSAKFPVSKSSLKRKFIRDLTGQTFLRLRLARLNETKVTGSEAFEKGSITPTIIANIILFILLASMGAWWAYFILWLLPLATVFFAVLRLRNIAEHAMTTRDDNPLTHARTTTASLFSRVFFAPYFVNFHVEHHAYMYVPCYRLPALHKSMIAAGHGSFMEQKNNYKDVLQAVVI